MKCVDLVILSMLSLASLAPAQVVNPTSLSFESVPPHVTPHEEIQFTNTGTSPLTLSVSVDTPFVISENRCESEVKPGNHCNLWLTYTAQNVGEQDTGNLSINYGSGSVKVPLQGNGVAFIEMDPLKSWNFRNTIHLGFPIFVYASFTLVDPYYYQLGCGGQVVWTCTNGQGGSGGIRANLSLEDGNRCTRIAHKGKCLRASGSFVPNQDGQWSCTITYPGDGVCGATSASDSFKVIGK